MEELLKSIEPDAVRNYIEAEDFQYFKGIAHDKIAGVVALRNGSHLFHLFVAEAYQGRGCARMLWEYVKRIIVTTQDTQLVTVNSTLSAVPIYERFGFRKTGGIVREIGIAFVPMALDLQVLAPSKKGRPVF